MPFQLYLNTNTANSNVVRVAPRPKNQSSYNNFPQQIPSSFYYPNQNQSTNYPLNYTINYPIAGSTLTCNPFLVKNNQLIKIDKKFNSLKSSGVKKSPQFYSMRINKCKRHHSLVDPNKILIENGTKTFPFITASNTKFYDQPLYENLTDSIQIHESSLNNETSYIDYNNCEPERNSIYRSDSGISNSSYECITPVPAPRTQQRKCQSAPVYMNLPNPSPLVKNGQQQNHHSKCKTNLLNTASFFNYEVR